MSPVSSFLLDANTAIFFLRGNLDIERKMKHLRDRVYISTPALAEVYNGVLDTHDKKLREKKLRDFQNFLRLISIIDFKMESVVEFAKIHAELRLRRKKPRGDKFDLMIAAVARANKMTLVSDNTKHFEDISHLKIVNWMKR